MEKTKRRNWLNSNRVSFTLPSFFLPFLFNPPTVVPPPGYDARTFLKIELNPVRPESKSLASGCLGEGSMSITAITYPIERAPRDSISFRVLAKRRPPIRRNAAWIFPSALAFPAFVPIKRCGGGRGASEWEGARRFVRTANGVTRMQPRFSEIADSNVFDVYSGVYANYGGFNGRARPSETPAATREHRNTAIK